MIIEFPSFPIGSAFLECRYETRKLAFIRLVNKAETNLWDKSANHHHISDIAQEREIPESLAGL